MASKRKKLVVFMDKKLEALNRIDKGELLKNIAAEYGVGTSTVSDWKKNRKEIEDFCFKMITKDSLQNRGTVKKARNESLDDALFIWFSEKREHGVPISGPILQEKALSLNSKLANGDPNFTASQGWLERWKARHGIRQLSVSGESLSGDKVGADSFVREFQDIISSENLTQDQIYNADESGLFYRLLPSKTLASRLDDSAKGFKRSKDRVTIMACANASGRHKFPLLLIGKSKNPRPLKNVNRSSLPVSYKSQKNAWMDCAIFKNWFQEDFVPSVKKFLAENGLPLKAILFIDNAPSHPGVEELLSGDIRVKFLPPNVTALLQPMDQGVLENIKRVYRRQLLTKLIEGEGEDDVISLLKSVNIKDVIYMIASAWDQVREIAIKLSWKKLWPAICASTNAVCEVVDHSQFLDTFACIPGCSDVNENDVSAWLKNDSDVGYGIMTDDEIIAACTSAGNDESDCEFINEIGAPSEEIMTHVEAMTQLDKLMVYLECQAETTPAELMLVKRLRDRAARKRCTNVKQKKLTHYFSTQN